MREDRIRLANFLLRAMGREWAEYDRFVHVIEPGQRKFRVDALGLALIGAHMWESTALEACLLVRQAGLRTEEEAARFLKVSAQAVSLLEQTECKESLPENIPLLLKGQERPKRPLTDYYAGKK